MTSTPGFADVAMAYHLAGWHPFPLPRGEKSPPPGGLTGRGGKDPTTDDIEAWCASHGDQNVGIRMPVGVIGIDVDEYDGKTGAGTLHELIELLGPLPATWSSTSRGAKQPSRILFYRVPAGIELPGTLGRDIEAIQRHHRFAVVAPSTRRDTGQRYRWYNPAGEQATRPPNVDKLPELPAAWIQHFTAPKPSPVVQKPETAPRATTGTVLDNDSIAERIKIDHDWHTVLLADGWQLHHHAGDTSQWTRPGKDTREGTSAVLHEPDGPFNVFTTSVHELQQPWAETGDRSAWTYSMFGYLAATRHNGDRSECARAARMASTIDNYIRSAGIRLAERTDNDEEPHGPVDQPHTDLGNARRFVAHHGHDLRYAPQWGTWLVWDGARWAEDITGEAHRRAKAIVDGMLTQLATMEGDEARKKLFGHWNKSQSAPRLDAMVHIARTEPGIPVTIAALDADPWILNTRSGAINLRTGEITAQDRHQLVTKLAPTTVDPTAACPTWEWFVDWAMQGDRELVEFVQRAVGYSLTGTVSEQCLFFLHGGGANGKSTFLSVIQQLMGDYAASAEPDLLLATTHERHPAGVADLLGRRLVVVQETDEGRRLAEATVKQLTGGDTIKARRMRENFFEFRPTHKLWMAANHRPSVRGTDHAIWRRIRMIPFVAQVAPDDQDPTLLDRLLEELPGILQWALAGCRAWREHGLRPPEAVLAATQDYRTEQDHIGRFLDECCAIDRTATITAKDLRTAYEAWCAEGGERPWSAKAMAPHLIERGCALERTMHARLWRGLALAGEAADALSERNTMNDWTLRASGDHRENASDASSTPAHDASMTLHDASKTRRVMPIEPGQAEEIEGHDAYDVKNGLSTSRARTRAHDPRHTEEASDASSRVMALDDDDFKIF